MEKYKVIDLFCGCGGISVGFELTKKCKVIGAIDFNEQACDTYKLNFPSSKVLCGDITQISVSDTGFKDIDIIVGGPPCQGFSALNRHNKDLENDPRNVLFFQFIRFVKELQPKAIMIENVRQILTSKQGYAKNTICQILNELGYNIDYKVLNASDYGVPQKRMRAVFVGVRKDIGTFAFDSLKTRVVKTKTTVDEAFEDLYPIEDSTSKSSDHKIDKLITNNYLKIMHDGTDTIHNHLMQYPNKRVQNRVSYVKEGENWRSVPEELFPSHRNNRHSNYLRRLDGKGLSITVDTGHDVYFHPRYNRVPTVRETARIQSFPDSFVFTGTRMQQLRQVGNAVPPLMAKAIAESIMEVLNEKK